MNKILNLLTICRKAGKLCMGFDPVKESIEKGKAKLVLLACDLSPKTEKEIRFFAEKKSDQSVKIITTPLTLDEFYFGLGKKAGVFAICDEGFAKSLSQISDNSLSQ